jgi:hypothetical protein
MRGEGVMELPRRVCWVVLNSIRRSLSIRGQRRAILPRRQQCDATEPVIGRGMGGVIEVT